MKLQFDANQPFQLAAISAVTDLFNGQPQSAPEFSVLEIRDDFSIGRGQNRNDLGLANELHIDPERLQANTRIVQERNDIEVPDQSADLEAWELFDAPADRKRRCPHFSVEMETGTGKTYVYLRTIFELSHRFGFQKFIIVVPSVAIREGVLKSIEIMTEHFRELYSGLCFEHFVYDAKRPERLRPFSTSNMLQICVINIQAFNKKDSAVIYKEMDKLSGRQPIEFVQAARPIVIIDEPQSVEGGEGGAGMTALMNLNPLCTLRYSATHRNPYNLIYRLDPVRAFSLNLVKQIIVASPEADGAANDAFVRVERIDYQPRIRAKLRIHVQGPNGPKEKSVTVRQEADLFVLSNERACYKEGFEVAEIWAEPGSEYIRFANGRTLRQGEEMGGMCDDIWRTQIRDTLKRHLDKELQVRERGIKVLSLFFIDRVANYRDYDESGQPAKGKFAAAFEAELAQLAKEDRYNALSWLKEPVDRLHNGYFAKDKKGVLKDTRGDSQADDEVYNLIMKDKERLLSMHEPLRFIFSHSALREGWDNPNVFQICTLNETGSAIKKRQEIGRGLRLPVDQDGKRVFDPSVNRLYVMANESYEDFARGLQTEYEQDCGVTFGKVPLSALARIVRIVDEEELPIGREAAEAIMAALVEQKMLDQAGRILPAFTPSKLGFSISLPEEHRPLASSVIDLLSSYQIERHVRREREEGINRLKKEVSLSPEFEALWERIKPKTTYRVEFETETLVRRTVDALKRDLEKIDKPVISVVTGKLEVLKGGVTGSIISASKEKVDLGDRPLPDLLTYLQNETELTRSTLVRILHESGRLAEFFNNPQRFMDGVARILKHELHRLLVDEIKYERIEGTGPDAEWEMRLFKHDELINYLTALKVEKSVYEYVPYDSEIELNFARALDARDDIKLFVKLPPWFEIDTPVGKYNPDWAILKHDDSTLYLVRETKGNRDFLKLRSTEADKIRCGKKHFDTLGVPFDVVVNADDV